MKPRLHRLAILALLLLGGCATAPAPPPSDWESRRSELLAATHWSAQGKIALRSAEQTESASLSWYQAGDQSQLQLSGPLGFSATTIESNATHFSIRQGDEYQRWALDDPALQEHNPWQLPLKSLHYWLKGIPAPQVSVQTLEFDPATRLPRVLRQQGWTVEYQGYAPYAGHHLPVRIEVSRDSTRARIVLREWEFQRAP